MLIQMNERGMLTIPKEMRGTDTLFDAVRREDGVIELRPKIVIDASQAWFWTPEWQAGERRADENYAAGRYKRFDTMEEFFADLTAAAAEYDAEHREHEV